MELKLEETSTVSGQRAVLEEWQVRFTEYSSFSLENTDFNIGILWYIHKRRQYDFKGILISPPYIDSLQSYLHFCLESTMGNNVWLPPLFKRLSMDFFTFVISTSVSTHSVCIY